MRRRSPHRAVVAALLALASPACGYRFTSAGEPPAGAEKVAVRPFQNLSAEPELGAAVAASLRRELARRGAEGRGDAAFIDGEVRTFEPVPSTPGAVTWRVAVEARARLVVSGEVRAERTVRREADYLAGVDALETEGRRAIAVRRLADEIAGQLLRDLWR